MCVAFIALRAHRAFPLVLVHNRDEFYGRPTERAHLFDGGRVLGGRDMEGGGTWLGVGPGGRFAFVTNIRLPREDERPEGLQSRGRLPLDFLKGSQAPEAFLEGLQATRGDYGPFNIVVGRGGEGAFLNSVEGEVRFLEPGIYGVSNGSLDTPWPKLVHGKATFSQILRGGGALDEAALIAAMDDDAIPPDDALPDTGIELEWERALGAIFVKAEIYGTRTTTLLTLDNHGNGVLRERTWPLESEGLPGPRDVIYRYGV